MRIQNLTQLLSGTTARVSANIVWEESDREPFVLFFETQGPVAENLGNNPHAFLVASLVPAMYFGERRLHIEGRICSELLVGLETNMRWLEHWSGGQLHSLHIDCARGRDFVHNDSEKFAGSFLSGGVDSLATLRTNRLNFSRNHPASIRDCVMVQGFDIGGMTKIGAENAFFDRSVAALEAIVQSAGVTLMPISTNLRLLHDDVHFWMHYFHGAALAAVAHLLDNRLARIYVGSSFNVPIPAQWGSHPLLDANYGSYALQIRHDGLNLTRLEKVRVVADWDVALQNLRVCTMNPATGLNCGVCEKCIRTMLELLAVGKLEQASSFSVRHVDPSRLEVLKINADYQVTWYRELLDPLASAGQDQITKIIRAKLTEYDKRQTWEQEKDWKGAVKRFDRSFLGSKLYRSWKSLRPRLKHESHEAVNRP